MILDVLKMQSTCSILARLEQSIQVLMLLSQDLSNCTSMDGEAALPRSLRQLILAVLLK